jgi:hypothetical protein
MPKISELTTTSDLSGDELVPIVKAGTTQRTTVDAIREFTQFADYTAFRAYTGTARSAYVTGFDTSATTTPSGIAGNFTRDDSDTTSADNGGTTIVDANGVRWKRTYDGPVNVRWFGAVGDGVTDDTAAIQAALDAVGNAGGGCVYFPAGTYLLSSRLLVWGNTKVYGAGMGATTIKHPASHAFKNKNYLTTGDDNITVSDMSFDADATYSGAVSMDGMRNLTCERLKIGNVKPTTVTVGIGLSTLAGVTCENINIHGCVMDVPDYGIVLSSNADGLISKVSISNNRITSTWGSCIALNYIAHEVSITGNILEMTGTGTNDSAETGVGIGVKLVEGVDVSNASRDVTITGNTFVGAAARTKISGVSCANFASNIVVTGNTFRECSHAFFNNFAGTGAKNITFSNNVVRSCDNGFFNDNSSDVSPVITGNTFRDVTTGIKSSLSRAIVSGNQFATVAGKAIHAMTPSQFSAISANVFQDIGQEAFYMATNSASNTLCAITGNTFHECCIGTDNTYSVLELNAQAHIVSGNVFSNSSTTEKPQYIIGSTAAANYRIVTGNWMYGARSGYREIVGANDVYADNIERGGIG